MWFANTASRYGALLYKRDGHLLIKALSKAHGNATRIAREAATQFELSSEKVAGKQTVRMTLKKHALH